MMQPMFVPWKSVAWICEEVRRATSRFTISCPSPRGSRSAPNAALPSIVPSRRPTMSRRGWVVIVPPTQRGRGRFVNAACDVDGGTDDRYPEASMRWAVMVLVLVLVGVAGAEDDDAVLETPSLGEPIPERMQTLEKEWDDDVGTNDHAPAPADETDPFERNAAPADEPYVEDEAKPAPPTDEAPEPSKRASTLEQPL